jgi:hypothetical protein
MSLSFVAPFNLPFDIATTANFVNENGDIALLALPTGQASKVLQIQVTNGLPTQEEVFEGFAATELAVSSSDIRKTIAVFTQTHDDKIVTYKSTWLGSRRSR